MGMTKNQPKNNIKKDALLKASHRFISRDKAFGENKYSNKKIHGFKNI